MQGPPNEDETSAKSGACRVVEDGDGKVSAPTKPAWPPRAQVRSNIVPPRSPARRRHLQPVPQAHPLLGSLFPGLKKEEVELAAERIKLYGQREVIEILDGEVIAGWLEYLACVEAKVLPSYTRIDEEPDDLLEYVVRRNVPRHLSKLDRACVAVLAQAEFRKLAHERKRWGKGGLLRDRASRSSFGDRPLSRPALRRDLDLHLGPLRKLMPEPQQPVTRPVNALAGRLANLLQRAAGLPERQDEPVLGVQRSEPRLEVHRARVPARRAGHAGLRVPEGSSALAGLRTRRRG